MQQAKEIIESLGETHLQVLGIVRQVQRILDEISMVGQRMLNFINLRLQQIMGKEEHFGGFSVIVPAQTNL